MTGRGEHPRVGPLGPALAWVEAVAGPVAAVGDLTGGWTSTMLALTSGTGEELVLRLMTREPWRSHGPALTTRESRVQQLLAGTAVPAPGSLALDPDGAHCGHPAHLMTRLPGRVEADLVDPVSLGRLADLLVDIHRVAPPPDLRTYQSWAFEAKYVVPPWASAPRLWEEAFAVLRADPPAYRPCLIHRDFQTRNVLWSHGRVAGVVDWVETSLGPAWLDVAHCCTTLALRHGSDVADGFADAYVARTGERPAPYFDVMDVVGLLPPPDRPGFVQDPAEQVRLEQRLRVVLRRLAGGSD